MKEKQSPAGLESGSKLWRVTVLLISYSTVILIILLVFITLPLITLSLRNFLVQTSRHSPKHYGKIPATNNKVLVRTGSLLFFKKYRQPIMKFWSIPVPVRETVRKTFFSATQEMLKIFIKRTCVYMEQGNWFILWGVSVLCISSMS